MSENRTIDPAAAPSTFIEKIMDFLQGGNEGKLARFHKRYVKSNDEQISVREKEIEDISDKLEDLAETANEDMLNVDMGSIKDIESTNSYIEDYRRIQMANLEKKETFEKEIATKKKEIERFRKLNSLVK